MHNGDMKGREIVTQIMNEICRLSPVIMQEYVSFRKNVNSYADFSRNSMHACNVTITLHAGVIRLILA